ncbi:hypothetical protein JOH51_006601 [Rhizobium leguminosarum]|nr:hypothetical protein [Rhizobium leguminosarum]
MTERLVVSLSSRIVRPQLLPPFTSIVLSREPLQGKAIFDLYDHAIIAASIGVSESQVETFYTLNPMAMADGRMACACPDGRVEIPHPRMTERAFVLIPLADIAPDLVVKGRRVIEWLVDADKTGIVRANEKGNGGPLPLRNQNRLKSRYGLIEPTAIVSTLRASVRPIAEVTWSDVDEFIDLFFHHAAIATLSLGDDRLQRDQNCTPRCARFTLDSALLGPKRSEEFG